MPLLSPAQLIDVPVVCGAAGQIVVQRALHQEPPHVDSRQIARMLVGDDPVAADYAAAYLRGDFVEHVLLRGAYCSGCHARLANMEGSAEFNGRVIRRTMRFPFRAPLRQVLSGGTCTACGDGLVFEFERGPEGGLLETTERTDVDVDLT